MRSRIIVLSFFAALAFSMPKAALCDQMAADILKIDDFDGKVMFNLLGGKTQGYEEAGIKCIPTFIDDPKERFGDKGASLKLDYDVTNKGFCYYWTALTVKRYTAVEGKDIEVMSFADLSGHDFLEFEYKDPKGGADFMVEIHEDVDGDGAYMMGIDRAAKVDVSPYVDKSAINKWQKVSIPLTKFPNIKDWNKILEIVFVFRTGYGTPKGCIYLDDIELVKYAPQEPPATTINH